MSNRLSPAQCRVADAMAGGAVLELNRIDDSWTLRGPGGVVPLRQATGRAVHLKLRNDIRVAYLSGDPSDHSMIGYTTLTPARMGYTTLTSDRMETPDGE